MSFVIRLCPFSLYAPVRFLKRQERMGNRSDLRPASGRFRHIQSIPGINLSVVGHLRRGIIPRMSQSRRTRSTEPQDDVEFRAKTLVNQWALVPAGDRIR